MKFSRRGFLQGLLGLAAAPTVAKLPVIEAAVPELTEAALEEAIKDIITTQSPSAVLLWPGVKQWYGEAYKEGADIGYSMMKTKQLIASEVYNKPFDEQS